MIHLLVSYPRLIAWIGTAFTLAVMVALAVFIAELLESLGRSRDIPRRYFRW